MEGNINHEVYIDILNDTLLPCTPQLRHYTLLQDNAPPHVKEPVKNWLRQHNIPWYENYPPSSPELNAIERVWGWMEHYINARGPVSKRRFRELIIEAWYAIPHAKIRHFIDHTRSVLKDIRAAEGGDLNE